MSVTRCIKLRECTTEQLILSNYGHGTGAHFGSLLPLQSSEKETERHLVTFSKETDILILASGWT